MIIKPRYINEFSLKYYTYEPLLILSPKYSFVSFFNYSLDDYYKERIKERNLTLFI